jgi:hypothetical protein
LQVADLGENVPPSEHPALLITSDSIKVLKPEIIAAAKATFIMSLTDAAIVALTPEQVKAIKPEALAMISPGKVNKLTDAALKVMTKAQLDKIGTGKSPAERNLQDYKCLVARHEGLTAPPSVWRRFWNWIKSWSPKS